jgi:hypothetical protein
MTREITKTMTWLSSILSTLKAGYHVVQKFLEMFYIPGHDNSRAIDRKTTLFLRLYVGPAIRDTKWYGP